MIHFITGKVIQKNECGVFLDVHGIGFYIETCHPEIITKNSLITLSIVMIWNQENGPSLFGFLDAQEKMLFEAIIQCSGFGPKIALIILKKFSSLDFIHIIQTGDIKTLSSINGIGNKKAEQLIVQFKHKIKGFMDNSFNDSTTNNAGLNKKALELWKDIQNALQSLNYSKQEIEYAMGQLAIQENNIPQFDSALRKALSILSLYKK